MHHVYMWFSRDETHHSPTHWGLLLDIPLFGAYTHTHTQCSMVYDACYTFLLTRTAHASTSLTYTHTPHPRILHCSFFVAAKEASDVCQTKLRTNTGTKSFILPDQMMRVAHTDTHAGFVLCDQMMRVAVRACYIHPPVPYIIPPPSILCDTSFDAL